MENASKALIMAAGVLIGVLILALIVVLFLAGHEVFSGYEETKTSEMVQKFNSNFIKYTGQDLTAHQVLTIINFANNNDLHRVTCHVTNSQLEDTSQMSSDISSITDDDVDTPLKKYRLTINSYTPNEGYVDVITIT